MTQFDIFINRLSVIQEALINLKITNNGEIDILQTSFDNRLDWGFEVDSGEIINQARLISTNSIYLEKNLNPKIFDRKNILMDKVIFEKNKYFVIEILVLHQKNNLPEIQFFGKIAGIENISPIKTWQTNREKNFVDDLLYGGILINLLRIIFITVSALSGLIIMSSIGNLLGKRKFEKGVEKRKKEIYRFFDGTPGSKLEKFLADCYIKGQIDEIKHLKFLTENPERIYLEKERFKKNQERREEIDEIEERMRKLSLDAVGSDKDFPDWNTYLTKHQIFWYVDRIEFLFEEGIVRMDEEGQPLVDSTSKKLLDKFIKELIIQKDGQKI